MFPIFFSDTSWILLLNVVGWLSLRSGLIVLDEVFKCGGITHVEHFAVKDDAHHAILFPYLLESGGELNLLGAASGSVDVALKLPEDFGGKDVLSEDAVVVGIAVLGTSLQVGLGIVFGGFLTEGGHTHDCLFFILPDSGDDAVVGYGVEGDGMDGNHRLVEPFILFDKLETAGLVGV